MKRQHMQVLWPQKLSSLDHTVWEAAVWVGPGRFGYEKTLFSSWKKYQSCVLLQANLYFGRREALGLWVREAAALV